MLSSVGTDEGEILGGGLGGVGNKDSVKIRRVNINRVLM